MSDTSSLSGESKIMLDPSVFGMNEKEFVEQKKPEIQEIAEAIKKDKPLMTHLVDSIISGEPVYLSDEQFEALVERVYFSFPSLNPLSESEASLLKKYIKFSIKDKLFDRRLSDFLAGDMYEATLDNGKVILFVVDEEGKYKDYPVKKMTKEDKMNLFNYDYVQKIANELGDGLGVGEYFIRDYTSRHLKAYSLGENSDWQAFSDNVRVSTGKKQLNVLDVGCCKGEALVDIKEKDENCTVTGITMENSFGEKDGVNITAMAGERTSEVWREKFDIILSNQTFRYLLYPGKVIDNVVDSLSPGGHAVLEQNFGGFHNAEIVFSQPEFMEIIKKELGDLEEFLKKKFSDSEFQEKFKNPEYGHPEEVECSWYFDEFEPDKSPDKYMDLLQKMEAGRLFVENLLAGKGVCEVNNVLMDINSFGKYGTEEEKLNFYFRLFVHLVFGEMSHKFKNDIIENLEKKKQEGVIEYKYHHPESPSGVVEIWKLKGEKAGIKPE